MKGSGGDDALKLRPKQPLYIALYDCDLDLAFYSCEIELFKEMWTDGEPLVDIAETMKRDPDELAILAIDLGRKNGIKKRSRGVYGSKPK